MVEFIQEYWKAAIPNYVWVDVDQFINDFEQFTFLGADRDLANVTLKDSGIRGNTTSYALSE